MNRFMLSKFGEIVDGHKLIFNEKEKINFIIGSHSRILFFFGKLNPVEVKFILAAFYGE